MIALPQLSGSTRPSSPGTTRSPAKSVAMPPAEERSSEPSASPIRVTPTRYATLPHRARVTPGSESAAVGPFPSRMVWERKNAALSDPGVTRALWGNVAYLVGVTLMGLALGSLLRSSAGGIATLFAGLLVVPGLLGLVLPDSWGNAVLPYLPDSAGQSFTLVDPSAGSGFGSGFRSGAELL